LGDTNGDDRVDIVDLNNVRNYFGASRSDVEWQSYVGFIPGDANGDDAVDIEDLNLVRNHFGDSGPGPAPSPAATKSAAAPLAPTATQLTDAVFSQLAAGFNGVTARRAFKFR
jgi:hypothetical protein